MTGVYGNVSGECNPYGEFDPYEVEGQNAHHRISRSSFSPPCFFPIYVSVTIWFVIENQAQFGSSILK